VPTNLPVICQLPDAERREREATLLSRFRSGVESTEELEDGYSFRLPGEKNWLMLVADLMIAERECCPFLRFQLIAEPQMGVLTVRITGPEGTKQFLQSAFLG
jgi:hypothetical protein